MARTANVNKSNVWDLNFFYPQPRQDSDLLQHLGFIPGLKEILMLRQVHALEHATVWILSETATYLRISGSCRYDNDTLGGLSTEQGFYIYGQVERLVLQRAVRLALERLRAGEWDLALHPRCGTNVTVAVLLTVGLTMGTYVFLPKVPLFQILGLSLASLAAGGLAPEIGISVQKYLTTSIPFNLKIQDISATADSWGRSAHFVRVQWQELQ